MKAVLIPVFAILIAVFTNAAYSQTYTLTGNITDENGTPVEFASVTLQELSVPAFTDKAGEFKFTDIIPGKYHLHIVRTGYTTKTIPVNVDGATHIAVTLLPGLIETPTIDVTSSFQTSDISNSTYSITSLGPRTITRTRDQNIASTIQNVPGVSNFSTGNAIGKPVIRGLTSQSVTIVKDGIKHESQQWGDEHGPEVSTFGIDRIEILRGPASLVYGADAIGGVINIISKPLTFSQSQRPVTYGTLDLNGFTVNEEGTGNLMLGMGWRNFSLKGSVGYRKSGNVTTPDGELTVQTPDGERTITGGELFNSGTKELEGTFNMMYKGDFGSISAIYESFNREIQIHEDPDEEPDATPNQKINTNHIELKGAFHLNKVFHLEPIVSFESHVRKEFESAEEKDNDAAELHLDLTNFRTDVRLQHELTKNINGTFGAVFNISNNETLAKEKLIPNYDANGYGVYLTEKFIQKYYTLSGGIRYDNKKQNIKETVFEEDENGNPTKVVTPRELTFDAVTGSFGIVVKPLEYLDIFGNVGRGWRAPSEFDMYADGEHEGTGRFDRGLLVVDSNAVPEPEESLNLDFGVRLRNKYISGEVSFFRNEVNNFIYPSPTGQTDPESGLPIYDIKQDKSSFIGIEYSLQAQPVEWMLLSFKGDFVNTENEVTGNPLPFTPPMKNIVEMRLQGKNFGELYNPYFSFTTKLVSAQDDVDPLEAPSEGYTLLSTGIGFDYILNKSIVSVDFSVTNLADTKYADHLSRYRYYAMNPGRSFNLKVSVPFEF